MRTLAQPDKGAPWGAFQALQAAQVRRAQATEQRSATRKTLGAALRTLAAAVASAVLSVGVWQALRWANGSEDFAVREIRFSGLRHATEAELLARSRLHLGENLFRADLPRAARAMEGHPWVASARLSRRLPGTIVAEISEHRPAALVQLGALYVLDEDGKLFKRAAPEDGLDLPLITGLSRESWQPQSLRLFAALHLLDTWQAAGLQVSTLSEVRLDQDGGFTLFAHDGAGGGGLAADGRRPQAGASEVQEIRLGASDLSLKLRRLVQIRSALARRGETATRIDLDNPARPAEAAATLADKR
jgi:cell division protein FtsQ